MLALYAQKQDEAGARRLLQTESTRPARGRDALRQQPVVDQRGVYVCQDRVGADLLARLRAERRLPGLARRRCSAPGSSAAPPRRAGTPDRRVHARSSRRRLGVPDPLVEFHVADHAEGRRRRVGTRADVGGEPAEELLQVRRTHVPLDRAVQASRRGSSRRRIANEELCQVPQSWPLAVDEQRARSLDAGKPHARGRRRIR